MLHRMVSLGSASLLALCLTNSVALAGTKVAKADPSTVVPVATPTSIVKDADTPKVTSTPTSGWFRIDTDSLQTQVWLGATHSVGSFSIASDIYVVNSFAEFDVGPSFTIGNLTVTPMVGVGFDFSTTNVASVIAPQLFTIYSRGNMYFESWIQTFVNSPFTDGAQDTVYTRNFALYKVAKQVQVGPQVELTYSVNEQDAMFEKGVISLPIGGRVNLGYGKNNTLGIFLGYETKALAGTDGVAGRFTFVRSW